MEIITGWDAVNLFAVMDWSESGDSGWMAGAFVLRSDAVTFAQQYARDNRRYLHCADVVPFNARVA